MRTATSLLDKKTAMAFLNHGVFISNKVPCMSQEEAVILLAEAMVGMTPWLALPLVARQIEPAHRHARESR